MVSILLYYSILLVVISVFLLLSIFKRVSKNENVTHISL